jgi:hypothetical protein
LVDIQTMFALFLILLSSVLSGLTDLSFTLNGCDSCTVCAPKAYSEYLAALTIAVD